MKDLYIVGAGGFGREVAWLIERVNQESKIWNLKGFIDDNIKIHGTYEDDYQVLGGCDFLQDAGDCYVVCAIGASAIRKKVVEKISGYKNVHFATLIDPDVKLSSRVKIGDGVIICAGTIITVDVTIGDQTIINLGCTVGHDAVLAAYNTLYPSVNVSGNVVTGECVELGTGMQIIQGKHIGENSILGAGAVVVKDIPSDCTAVGAPAKVIKFHSEIV